jgi:hypothetical protein
LTKEAMRAGSRSGQAILLLIVAMSLFLVGALGLAIDGAQMYAQRQMAQAAADAAAEAGIMSIFDGTWNPTTASSPCVPADTRTPCVYARYNGFGGTTADLVTLSFPAAATLPGVSLSSGSVPALTVTVQRTLQTGMIRLVGAPATSSITAKATAALVGTVSPDSIIVLATPGTPGAGANAFQANNGASITISGGGSIMVESGNSDAATFTGGASVTASAIDIVGGDSISNGASTQPTAVTGVPLPSVPDPLVSLAAPAAGACLYTSMYYPATGANLIAGNYCGGITVSNGATGVVFGAGNYIITGGGLTFGGGATASGTGVMFYLTGTNATYASVNIANGVTVNFSAPTTGTYQGILFYQDRAITSASNATFAGGASMTLNGTLYFPTTSVSYSNGVGNAGYTAIVSNGISFAGGANINYDSTGQKTGLFTKTVALVQ